MRVAIAGAGKVGRSIARELIANGDFQSEGKGGAPFAEIGCLGLAGLGVVSPIVEKIIGNLEGHANVKSVTAEGFRRRSGQNGPNFAACLNEGSRFHPKHFPMIRFGQLELSTRLKLAHFSFG